MKLNYVRKSLKTEFENNDIDSIDADFIIAEVLNVSHTELNLIDEISDSQFQSIQDFAKERLQGKPIDKIFKKRYFYGLEFVVDENVLTPRSDSEILVERALKIIKENNLKSVLDLCTGSGCLAIAVKKNANVDVTASDISTKALKIAKLNAKNLQAEINFIHSDMFDKIENKFDLIISNPPYIASDDIDELDLEVKDHDPRIALDGGELGLKFYNIIHNITNRFIF